MVLGKVTRDTGLKAIAEVLSCRAFSVIRTPKFKKIQYNFPRDLKQGSNICFALLKDWMLVLSDGKL